jgi:hypothetical protein
MKTASASWLLVGLVLASAGCMQSVNVPAPAAAPAPAGAGPVTAAAPPVAGETEEAKAIAEAMAQLSDEDRALATAQGACPVGGPLGSMGVPIKVDVAGRPVFICCEGCRAPLLKDPEKYLAKLPPAQP